MAGMTEQQQARASLATPTTTAHMPWWGVVGWVIAALTALVGVVEGGFSTRGWITLAIAGAVGLAGVVVWAVRIHRA